MKTKNILFAIICMLAMLVSVPTSAVAQEIPKGAYVAQSSGDGEIIVYWNDHNEWPQHYYMKATIINGEVWRMYFRGGSHDIGDQFDYSFSVNAAEPESTLFKTVALKKWKKFVMSAYSELVVISPEFYAERTPFTFIGFSQIVQNHEAGRVGRSLIFRKGERLLAIPFIQWMGNAPTNYQQVVIAQDHVGERFIPITMTNGYVISAESQAHIDTLKGVLTKNPLSVERPSSSKGR